MDKALILAGILAISALLFAWLDYRRFLRKRDLSRYLTRPDERVSANRFPKWQK